MPAATLSASTGQLVGEQAMTPLPLHPPGMLGCSWDAPWQQGRLDSCPAQTPACICLIRSVSLSPAAFRHSRFLLPLFQPPATNLRMVPRVTGVFRFETEWSMVLSSSHYLLDLLESICPVKWLTLMSFTEWVTFKCQSVFHTGISVSSDMQAHCKKYQKQF